MIRRAGLFAGLLMLAWPALAAPYLVPGQIDLTQVIAPWPEAGTPAAAADLEAVRAAQAFRTEAVAREATTDASRSPLAWAGVVLGPAFTAEAYPLTTQLILQVHEDQRAINRAANAAWPLRPRPNAVDGRVTPSLALGAPTSSYPSARTASTWLLARLLADLMPDRQAALFAHAERSAWLRLVGGVHFPSDILAGRQVGDAVWAMLIQQPRFLADLAAARAELAAEPLEARPMAP